MTSRYDGKVVAVTGAGSGMGRAMAMRFARDGARVAVIDLTLEAAQRTVDELNGEGFALAADVSSPVHVRSMGDAIRESLGCPDVLCSNAGFHDNYVAALDTDLELWNKTIGVNLTAHYLVTTEFLPGMIDRGAGVIITTASTASFNAGGGGAAYTASKHGLLGYTRQLALDYGSKGVRVNAICPGGFATAMTAHLWSGDDRNPLFDEYINSSPLGRWGQAEEVADLAAFLASDDARFIHGVPVVIDGGQSLR